MCHDDDDVVSLVVWVLRLPHSFSFLTLHLPFHFDRQRVFRKKALKFHPDKYHPDNHEDGMTKDEAENHFKDLSNAYDHMMGKFD